MTRKRKTPPELAKVIMERHPAVIEHLEEMLRLKRTLSEENQPRYVKGRTEAEMVAFVNGYSACLEEVMHVFKCYAGFHNYGPPVKTYVSRPGSLLSTVRHQVAPANPDYLEWRKLYYTNGIAKK
jgi:hypothetical protein